MTKHCVFKQDSKPITGNSEAVSGFTYRNSIRQGSSPKETSEGSITKVDSGLGSGQDQLSRESRGASVSPVAKTGSHLSRCHKGSDDDKPPQGAIHSFLVGIHQQSHFLDYKPSSVSGDEQHPPDSARMKSGSSTQACNLPGTSPQVDMICSPRPKGKQRPVSSEASEDSSTKRLLHGVHGKMKKKREEKKSGDKTPVQQIHRFTMH